MIGTLAMEWKCIWDYMGLMQQKHLHHTGNPEVKLLPTKLKFTRRSASNMHAALVLLNWPLTFGTGL
jgi:hypothetical protein